MFTITASGNVYRSQHRKKEVTERQKIINTFFQLLEDHAMNAFLFLKSLECNTFFQRMNLMIYMNQYIHYPKCLVHYVQKLHIIHLSN